MHREAFTLYRLFIMSKAFLASNDSSWTHIFQKCRYGYKQIKFKTFEDNPSKKYFYAFAKKGISDEKFVRLCACAYFVRGQKFWIHDLVSEEVLTCYMNIQTYLDNFADSYKSDIKNNNIRFAHDLTRKGVNYPVILELYIQKKVSLPFLLTFERSFNVLENWDKNVNTPGLRFIWDSYYRSIKKWNGFFFEGELPEICLLPECEI